MNVWTVIERSFVFSRQASFSVAGCGGPAPVWLKEATPTRRMLCDDESQKRRPGTSGPLR